MFRSTFVVVLLLTGTSSAAAQNPYVLEIYGDGVHAFHRGEIAQARAQFDKAINNGSRDPRVFYYRALTNLQYGDQASADQDIRTGVTFELQGLGTYDIGRALERVQGPHRIEFEEQRLDIKLAISGPSLQPPRSVQPLLDPSVIDEPPLADDLPPDAAPALDPFRDDDGKPSDATDLDLDDTMPDEDTAADAPEDAATEDPFGEEMPATEPPAAEPSAEEDPFGADAAEDDPFAEPADAAAEDDPFGSDMGADDAPTDTADDPFGNAPATDATDDPAEDDPFG